MFALGLLSWLYTRPTGAPRPSSRASSPTAPTSSRPTSPRCAPASTTARRPRTSSSPTRSRPRRCPRAPTATSPATSPLPGPRRRRPPRPPAALPRLLPDHPGVRHPAHPRRPQALRRDDDAGRGRDRRRRRRARRALRRGARGDDHLGAGPGPQGRDDRSGGLVELPMSSSTSSGRPEDRPADQDEQAELLQAVFGRNGEAGGDRRGSRRESFYMAIEGCRLATRYRTPVHVALRRISRQWLRAVAGSERRRSCPRRTSSTRRS